MNVVVETIKPSLMKRILFNSAKLPAFYLLVGIILNALSYIDNVFPLTQWKHLFELTDKIGTVFIVFAAVTFVYNVLVLICRKYEKKLAEKHAVPALILSSIRKALRIIFILIAINVLILLVGPTKFYLILAKNIINTIIIGSIGWIAVQILYTCEAVLYQYMMSLSRQEHLRVKALYTKMHIIRNITTFVIIVITIAAILMSFSSVRNIGISLLASAGFLTAIIGLAAQKTLFALFSGLQIALAQSIKIGDIVVIENVSGIIEEITFTYVTLKLGDKRRLVVPINYFIEKPFENWSREPDSIRDGVRLFVDYMLPITPLREELKKILENSIYWDKRACQLQIANLTERCVEIRIQISAANADDLSELRSEVREKMLEFIRENYPDQFPKLRFGQEISTTQ